MTIGSKKQALEAKLKEVTQAGGWRDTIAIEHTADPLSVKRLAAVPWAPLCIHCQRRADHVDHGADLRLDAGFARAA